TLARPGQLEAHSPLPARLGCGLTASAPSRPGWPSPTRSRCRLGCLTHWAGGFDGGKWVKGRKRHVLVDSMGLLLAVVVTAANIADQQGLPPLLRWLQFRRGWFHRLRLIWGDRAYGGQMLGEWVLEHFHCMLEVLERPRGRAFRLVPRRCSWSAPWPGFPGAGGSARTMKSCHALGRPPSWP
ncbi:MAG: hypothetical protein BRC39_10700, partial [Cyanobacteria bacterium QH_7_48_89]